MERMRGVKKAGEFGHDLATLKFSPKFSRFTRCFANTSCSAINVSYIVHENMTIPNPSGWNRAPLSK